MCESGSDDDSSVSMDEEDEVSLAPSSSTMSTDSAAAKSMLGTHKHKTHKRKTDSKAQGRNSVCDSESREGEMQAKAQRSKSDTMVEAKNSISDSDQRMKSSARTVKSDHCVNSSSTTTHSNTGEANISRAGARSSDSANWGKTCESFEDFVSEAALSEEWDKSTDKQGDNTEDGTSTSSPSKNVSRKKGKNWRLRKGRQLVKVPKLPMPAEVAEDEDIQKYWHQRYRLFSRYDMGILLDKGLIQNF